MKIDIRDGLAFVSGALVFQGSKLELQNVVVDTGSSGSVFSSDKLSAIGFVADPQDIIHQVQGVGGVEYVVTRRIDRLTFDELQAENFEIEIGAMDYGFEADGIVGLDFLVQTGAFIDFARLEIGKSPFALPQTNP